MDQIRVDQKHAERGMRTCQFIPRFTEEVERDSGARVRAGIMSDKTCKTQRIKGSVKFPRKLSTFFTEDPNLKAKMEIRCTWR